jgi:hypothetical protein
LELVFVSELLISFTLLDKVLIWVFKLFIFVLVDDVKELKFSNKEFNCSSSDWREEFNKVISEFIGFNSDFS